MSNKFCKQCGQHLEEQHENDVIWYYCTYCDDLTSEIDYTKEY